MKTIMKATIFFLVLTAIVGGVYPLVVFGVSQAFFKHSANGGIITHAEKSVGAELIAQEFKQEKFFWARPSAASYNASASSGSNLALTNADLQKAMIDRKTKGHDYDLLTTSGSGLDPHISPKAAHLQVTRVAKTRGMDAAVVTALVKAQTEQRQLGFIGEQRVNVLKLNLELEKIVNE